MLSLNEFLTFAAVADLRSFSRAAEKLQISNALVSRHIADLETTLGCKLLKRTTRSIGLTPAGALFHERCVQLVAQALSAQREVENLGRSEASGSIAVSGGPGFGAGHLVRAVAAFTREYPSIQVTLDLSERAIDLVAGDTEIAVRTADERRLNALVARKLAPLRRVLCASPEFLQRHRRPPRTPQELSEYPCVLYRVDLKDEWAMLGPEGRVSVRVAGPLRTNNTEAVAQAVLAGVGIAMVTTFSAAEHLRSGRMVRVLPDYEGPARMLYAAHLPDRNLPPRIGLFMSFLARFIGPEPYWDAGLFAPKPSR